MAASYELTVQDYLEREAKQEGVCVCCGTWTDDVDPAAARLTCRSCGEKGVHGVDQALMLGVLRICP